MDWFERLTGFTETDYAHTRSQLEVDGRSLRSRTNGKAYGIGVFKLISLQDIRRKALSAGRRAGRISVQVIQGDIRELHRSPELSGALFQVASQFNMLEMTSPDVTPEHGVTRYEHDRTQGPACAIAAGAATIYRNYFVPTAGGSGQTSARQLDGLHPVGEALATALGKPAASLWEMRNGYALCTELGLRAISDYVDAATSHELECLRDKLCIGLHHGVEVTDVPSAPRPIVSQAFCSALPIAYSDASLANWRAFSTLILDAAYEATLWAALDNSRRGGSSTVLLTSLGGGAFGNPSEWIYASMRRALALFAGVALDVRIVSHGAPTPEITRLVHEFTIP